MILGCRAGGREFPRGVQAILQQALQLRDRRQQGQISQRGVAIAPGRLETPLDGMLERRLRSPQDRRLANHLLREREALFTFLNCPGLEATNWRAEQAIRPMVVTRKVWGATAPSPEPERKASWAAFCKPVASNSVLYRLSCRS